ncbi:MAG: ATP-binding cassette domain-containing protein [bacterium]
MCYKYPEGESSFALRGVSFTLEAGERVALMGANGSGKTTFVRCLNGLLKPISGDVCVDGMTTHDEKRMYDIRRSVGMVFQNPDNQIVATTVVREIAFGLENLGIPVDVMHERVEEALGRFHLEDYRDSPPHFLSGGERQRLAFAAVYVMRPLYLVLDEPTSLLDPRGREEVLRMVEREAEENQMGILLVTQYPEETLAFDRLVIMDAGEIVLEGPPRAVFQHEEDLGRLGLSIPVEITLGKWVPGWDADQD